MNAQIRCIEQKHTKQKVQFERKKWQTLTLLASAAKPVAADNSPRNPTTQHTIITRRSIPSFLSLFETLQKRIFYL